VEAPQSVGEIETIARSFPGVPLLFNYAEGGKTPSVTHALLRDLGFKLVIFPISTLLVATVPMRSVLAQIKADGTPANVLSSLLPLNDFLEFIGMPDIRELERRFVAVEDACAHATAPPAQPQE
jgi:2,3-dimethylmalate lyase